MSSKADREAAKLAADQRNAERAKLSTAQQLKVLDGRPGKSAKERARLARKEAEAKAQAKKNPVVEKKLKELGDALGVKEK